MGIMPKVLRGTIELEYADESKKVYLIDEMVLRKPWKHPDKFARPVKVTLSRIHAADKDFMKFINYAMSPIKREIVFIDEGVL